METELFKPFPLNPRVSVGNLGTIIRPNGKAAKQCNHSLGYLAVGIMIEGIVNIMKAHRVIAITWVPNPLNLPTVNHNDGNKKNNRADNLSWMTLSDNHKHAWATGLQSSSVHSLAIKGHKPSAETKAKMRAAKLGKFRDMINKKWVDVKPKSNKPIRKGYKERQRLWTEKLKEYRKNGDLPM